jgi:hypothetical protein
METYPPHRLNFSHIQIIVASLHFPYAPYLPYPLQPRVPRCTRFSLPLALGSRSCRRPSSPAKLLPAAATTWALISLLHGGTSYSVVQWRTQKLTKARAEATINSNSSI